MYTTIGEVAHDLLKGVELEVNYIELVNKEKIWEILSEIDKFPEPGKPVLAGFGIKFSNRLTNEK